MIVVDASALAETIARTRLGERLRPHLGDLGPDLHAPGLIDVEVASALKGLERSGELSRRDADRALVDLADTGLVRYDVSRLVPLAWAFRANFSIYDALYVVLAVELSAPLLTIDRRLADAVSAQTGVELLAVGDA